MAFGIKFLEVSISTFHKIKSRGENAIKQVSDADLTKMVADDTNSVAMLVNHLAGNMRSRWTNFFTEDLEKPDRDRDSEFYEDYAPDRKTLIERWEEGWFYVFNLVESLKVEDLMKIVHIRGEPHYVFEAILRQLDHYSGHVGQIVLISKIFAEGWETLSLPRRKRRSTD